MYIDKLRLKDFGKFHNYEIELRDGLNVIYGNNEAGKSTIRDFMIGMLYGIDKSRGLGARSDMYRMRKPMEKAEFKGSADIYADGKHYLLERDFLKSQKSTTLMEQSTGNLVELKKEHSLRGILFDVDKATYMNTLCIGPNGAATGKDLAVDFKDYLVDMSTTKTVDIDRSAAIEYLKEEKRSLSTREIEDRMAVVREQMTQKRYAVMELDNAAKELEELSKKQMNYSTGSDSDANDKLSDEEIAAMVDEELKPEKDYSKGNRPYVYSLIFLVALVALTAIIWWLPFAAPLKYMLTILAVAGMAYSLISAIRAKKIYEEDMHRRNQLVLDAGKRKQEKLELEKKQEAFRISELKLKLELLAVQKQEFDKLQAQYNELKKQMETMEAEKNAIDSAILAMEKLSSNFYDEFGGKVNQQVSNIVNQITNGKYSEVKVTDDLHVKVKDGDSYVDMEFLSTATIEQIYLAVRLVMAELLCTDNMPIIIDDPFVTYDDDRLKNALVYLSKNAKGQVIYLTCNPRAAEIIEDCNKEYNYIALS